MSWTDWVERWERQQERYLVDREGRFGLMVDYAQARFRNDAILVAMKRTAA
jgi:hypothetical protein